LEEAGDFGESFDEDEEGDEDDEEDSDESRPKKPTTLGKRKASTLPRPKPPKSRPDKKPKKGGARVEIEYEHEMESVPLTKSALANW